MSHEAHDQRRGQPMVYGIIAAVVGAMVLVRPGWKTVAVLFVVASVLTFGGALLASIVDELNRRPDE